MDFQDFISIIIFLFFVVPPYLKRRAARQKKRRQASKKQSLELADNKLTDNNVTRHTCPEAGDGTTASCPDVAEPPAIPQATPKEEINPFVSPAKEHHETMTRILASKKAAAIQSLNHGAMPPSDSRPQSHLSSLPDGVQGLQQAMVWSIILGKPRALENQQSLERTSHAPGERVY